MRVLASCLLAASLLVGCAEEMPRRGASDQPPELIPASRFFANRHANYGYRVSPDGTKLGWIASHQGRSTIFFRPVDSQDTGILDTHSRRSIHGFRWAQDSRHVLYLQDRDGDENSHVYLADTEAPAAPPVDLTPWPDSRSWIHRVIRSDPSHVIVESNRRDRTIFDLYRVSLATGQATLIAENPGDVTQWMTDWEGAPRARLKQLGTSQQLEVLRAGTWRAFRTLDGEEFLVELLGVTPDDRGLWLLSGHGRDRRELLRVDLETGTESIVYRHPRVDVEWARVSERTREPLVVSTNPDYPTSTVFDAEVAAVLERLKRQGPANLWILSLDDAERRMTVQVNTDKGYESYLVERGGGEPVLLGRSSSMAFADALASVEPVAFKSRDGLPLHGYLTRPAGFAAPGPLVLVVHGGHWWRDYWLYDPVIQFLANRGYAVFQVNYRGSTGYGRRFMEAAIGEYAGKMHDDLVDAVRWAVKRGIADPKRVGIYGVSYGGYAALVGMTFTPEVFACGVSVVGMSNLVTLFETIPPYWKLTYVPRFLKYIGDPYTDEGRRALEARSPLFKVDRVRGSILLIHGAQDSRVNARESEQMATALLQAGKDARLVLLQDEGHRSAFGNWRNAVRMYGEVELFLARCLGGRQSREP
jgi:dipeptidyl aminopeptidase/acylaminoacyl peptidase